MADFDNRLKQLEEEIERRLVERFAALRDEFDRLRLESDHRWAGFLDRFDQKFSGIVPLELMQPEPPGEARAAAAAPAGGMAVAAAARSLDEAANQVDALHRFLDLCRNHCSRAALLVTRGGSAFVWKSVGFSDHGINDELIRRADLPSAPDSPLTRVLEGQPCELAAGNEISQALSAADATRGVLIAMVVKEKISGALYADCVADEESQFDPEALAFLTFLAGLIVDRLASRKLKPAPPLRPLESAAPPPRQPAAEARPAVSPETAPQPAATEPEFELANEPSVQAPAAEPGYRTQMMQAVPSPAPATPMPPPEFYGAPAAEPEPQFQMPLQRPSEQIPITLPPLEPEPSLPEEPAPGATVRIPTSMVEDALASSPPPEPQPLRPPPPPPAAPRPSTGARRLAGPLAPAEGDERREEARRFAKLLVSEIKLYNEKAVLQGREQGNIYELLKEDIDRSRQMYDERIPEDVRSGSNFFYEELVRILADGRADALGL
ncbi:MAG TPA: hypothetical protein VKE50_01340 [Thermoanaerobaculia bacterium]|nr:hypothetical protein [Thermoanaerobaculia bacterium]